MIPSDILVKEKLSSIWLKKLYLKGHLSLKKLYQNFSRFNFEVIVLIFIKFFRFNKKIYFNLNV